MLKSKNKSKKSPSQAKSFTGSVKVKNDPILNFINESKPKKVDRRVLDKIRREFAKEIREDIELRKKNEPIALSF